MELENISSNFPPEHCGSLYCHACNNLPWHGIFPPVCIKKKGIGGTDVTPPNFPDIFHPTPAEWFPSIKFTYASPDISERIAKIEQTLEEIKKMLGSKQ